MVTKHFTTITRVNMTVENMTKKTPDRTYLSEVSGRSFINKITENERRGPTIRPKKTWEESLL